MDSSAMVELCSDLLWFSNRLTSMRGGNIGTNALVIFAYWPLPNIH